MSRKILDIGALAALVALAAVFAVRLVDFHVPPFEDAAMLLRYAEHLAHGKGIVWNVGEPPLDGATDFLFMAVVAAVCRLGLGVETAARVITIASHFATVGVIYLGMRRVQRSGVAPAFLSALYFAVGPGLFLCAVYFGTPSFVLGIALSWLLAQRLLRPDGRTLRAYGSFAAACLVSSLVRPEGTLISIFMLAAVGFLLPRRDFFRLTAVFGSVFLVLGGTYFLWRWHYFGYPLPNPYYKKGGGILHIRALLSSIRISVLMGLPFIPMFLLAARSRETLRKGIAFLIPIVGTTCMWVLLSNEMNFGARFQYPLLALYVLSWYPLVRGLSGDPRLPEFSALSATRKAAVALGVVVVVGLVFLRQVADSRAITTHRDGRVDVGVMLGGYAERGYTIATTEAGLLPFYSRWRAIDTWGLNDRWIAHNGGITDEYLARQHPDVIMWHCEFSPGLPPAEARSGDPWFTQVMTLKRYAERNGFTLAAVFGEEPDNTHYYYVRADLPDHDAIVRAIRSRPYYWYRNGLESRNFAAAANETQP